jgi:hypothetical protein
MADPDQAWTPPGASPPGDAPTVSPPPSGQPEVPSTVDLGVVEDANSGRVWLMPTALSAPKGTWSFSDYELFLVSASYAFTDQLSVSAATLIPIVADQPFWGLFHAKLQILRAGNLRLAAQGAVTVVSDENDSFSAGELGAAATLCIDAECRSHVSGFLGAAFAYDDQSSVPFLVAGSLVAGLTKRVKLVLEADSGFIAGDINGTADGLLAWYGLRFTSRNIGVDLGLAKPIISGTSGDDEVFPIGFPFVSFTYRGLAND